MSRSWAILLSILGVCASFVAVSGGGGARVASAGSPDPALSSVEPWDSFANPQALVIPGADGLDTVRVTVLDSQGNPCAGAEVRIVFSGCTNLCIDCPDGLTGVTDGDGVVILDPRVGGCDDCVIEVTADGLVIGSYTHVSSPDWDGSADGLVGLSDTGWFTGAWMGPYDACADYNGDGVMDIDDYAIVYGAFGMGSANTNLCVPCKVLPLCIDFGCVPLGGWRDTTFTITSTGTGSLTGMVSETCPDFSISPVGSLYTLLPGEDFVVDVHFEATSEGTLSCTIDTGDLTCGDVLCTAVVEPTALCVVDPTFIDLGLIPLSASVDTSFAITLLEGCPLVGDVVGSCPDLSILSGGGPFSLCSGESLWVDIRFVPSELGPLSCFVDAGFDCGQVTIDAEGITPCVVWPQSVSFGSIPLGTFADTTFFVTNIGADTLYGDISESCSEFNVESGAGPFAIAQYESLAVSVRYQPTTTGTHNCTVETGQTLCADVSLSGTATSPCVVEPTSLEFDTPLLGKYSERTFIIANIGADTLSGVVSEPSSHYSIVSGGGPYELLGGDTLEVTVRFAPYSPGVKTCTVETGDDACADVACTGKGCSGGGAVACDFEDGTLQGWFKIPTFAGTLNNVAGNGGRCLEIRDTCAGCGTLQIGSPCGYMGDLSGYDGIQWDEWLNNCPPVGRRTFPILVGADGTMYEEADYSPGVLSTWHTLYVPFDSTAWDLRTGTAGFSEVLRNVAELRISTETNTMCELECRVDNVVLVGSVTSADEAPVLRLGVSATPNPFNPATMLRYTVPEPGVVHLAVYAVSGRLVDTLVDSGRHPSGAFEMEYRPDVATGVYFARLRVNGEVTTAKIVLIK